jgi:uncharacterized protein
MSTDGECAERLKRFRGFAESLGGGESSDGIRSGFDVVASGASVTDVGPAFLELVAAGTRRQIVRQLIDWFLESDSSSDRNFLAVCGVSGHPAEILHRENEALRLRVDRCRSAMERLDESPDDAYDHVRGVLKELSEVDAHYRRQEFLLFTRLERHELVRPGRILWAAHDEIRQWLRYLDLQFASDEFTADKLATLADSVVYPVLDDMDWMIFLEEELLFPMACDVLDEADWEVVQEHSPKIGWSLVEPGCDYQAAKASGEDSSPVDLTELALPTGVLSLETLALAHNELPVDLTFVDADDRVRYFTEGTRPVFYRSEAILGREVRCCHPPRSVHYVEQMLADFKSGKETSAQFWKYLGERFIHIRFVALRDETGGYVGTLEIAQEITHLQELEGQQLELCYDPAE